MTGLEFGSTRFGQRVVGNKINSGGGFMPDVLTAPVPTEGTWKMKGSEEKCDWTLIVMEPDITLNVKPSNISRRTYIQMFKKTEELVDSIKQLDAATLQDCMGLSAKTAKSHVERFQNFHKLPPRQASLLFGGDAFDVDDLDEPDYKYMEAHSRWVSGLYGVLRPFDDVKPVRDMPPAAAVPTKKGKTVLDFWGDAVSKQLVKDAQAGSAKKVLVLLLVSDEYMPITQHETFPKDMRVVRVSFEGASDSKVREARQKVGRYAVKSRLTNPEDFQDWEHEDWRIDKFKSSGDKLVFSWVGDLAGQKKDKKSKKGDKEEKGKSKKKDKVKGKDKKREASSSDAGSGASRSRSRRRGHKSRREPSDSASRGSRGRRKNGKEPSRSRGKRDDASDDSGRGRSKRADASPKRSRRRRSSSE